MVVKLFKHTVIKFAHSIQFISIILNIFDGNLSKKCVTKWTSKAGKCCIGELIHGKIYIIFYKRFGRTVKQNFLYGKTYYPGNTVPASWTVRNFWERWWNSNWVSYNVENTVQYYGPKLNFSHFLRLRWNVSWM
jgi:hypothetical protein